MWLFTDDGFCSAVEEKGQPDKVSVRSRDRVSLELLLDQVELAGAAEGPDGRAVDVLTEADIREGEGTDYRYRVTMSKGTFAVVVQHYILNNLTYRNFKDQVVQTRGEAFHDVLFDIWADHRKLDDVTGVLAPVPVAVTRRKGWR